MPWTVTIDGKTFTSANLEGNAYADEVSGFPGMLSAFAAEASALRGEASFFKGAGNLSTTTITPRSGEVSFTVAEEPAFAVGVKVRATSAAAPTNWMVGTVASIAGQVITVDVELWEGASARSDWVITYPISLSYMPVSSGTMTGPIDMGSHGLFIDTVNMKVGSLGSIFGTVSVSADLPMELRATLIGDAVLDFPSPETDHTSTWILKLTQGSPGGFEPVFADTTWLGAVVDWTAQTSGTETIVAVRLDEAGGGSAWAVSQIDGSVLPSNDGGGNDDPAVPDVTLVSSLEVLGDVAVPTGALGVGTTPPTEQLDVVGNIKVRQVDSLQPKMFFERPEGEWSLRVGDNGQFMFRDEFAADDLLGIHDGKVGIGRVNPQALLHLHDITPEIRLTDEDTGVSGRITVDGSTGALNIEADAFDDIVGSYIGFRVDGQESLRIRSDGDVSIGSVSDYYGLDWRLLAREDQDDVTRIGVVNGASGPNVRSAATLMTGTSGGFLTFDVRDNDGAPSASFSYGSIVEYVRSLMGGSEIWRINSDGDHGIGISSPLARLHVRSDTLGQAVGDEQVAFMASTATGNQSNVLIKTIRQSAGSNWSGTETRLEYNVDGSPIKNTWIGFHNDDSGSSRSNTIRFGEGAGDDEELWAEIRDGDWEFHGDIAIGTDGDVFNGNWRLVAREDKDDMTRIGVINAQKGPNASAAVNITGGTANSFARFDLRDNDGAPGMSINYGGGVLYERTLMGGSEIARRSGNGDYGIGTSAPLARLHVQSDALGEAAGDEQVAFMASTATDNQANVLIKTVRQTSGATWSGTESRLEYNVDGSPIKNTWIGFHNDDSGDSWSNTIRFGEGVGANERVWAIMKDGNVGINTDAPAGQLQVAPSSVGGWATVLVGSPDLTDGTARLEIGAQRTGEGAAYVDLVSTPLHSDYGIRLVRFTGQNANGALLYRGPGELKLIAQDAGAVTIQTNTVERMRVVPDTGYVGIGTSAPTERLHVEGNGYFTGQLQVAPLTVGGWPSILIGSPLLTTTPARLGVGAQRTGEGDAYVDLVSTPDQPDYSFRVVRYGGENTNSALRHRGTGQLNLNALDAGMVCAYTNGTERMRVVPDTGYVGIGTSAPTERLHVGGNGYFTGTVTEASDARLKTDILPIDDPIAVISSLNPVTYRKQSDPAAGREVGLVAQEVFEVLPEVVGGTPDGEGTMSVSYGRIVPLLIAAIQNQQQRIEALEQTIQ